MINFNPFVIPNCPICSKLLIRGMGEKFISYECPDYNPANAKPGQVRRSHYNLLLDLEENPVVSDIEIPGYSISYYVSASTTREQLTVIFKLDGPMGGSFKHLFNFDGYFPIDFANVNKSVERLNTLVTFS